jgi:hypothetical protein
MLSMLTRNHSGGHHLPQEPAVKRHESNEETALTALQGSFTQVRKLPVRPAA